MRNAVRCDLVHREHEVGGSCFAHAGVDRDAQTRPTQCAQRREVERDMQRLRRRVRAFPSRTQKYVWLSLRWVTRAAMENNAPCSWPVDGLPSPLSTDVEEISLYMRVAHALATSRDNKRSSIDRSN